MQAPKFKTLNYAGWLHVAQDGDHWSALADIVMIPWAQRRFVTFMSVNMTVAYSKRFLPHEATHSKAPNRVVGKAI
jgi:hypothetical protein